MKDSAVGAWMSSSTYCGAGSKWCARLLLCTIMIAMCCLIPGKGHAAAADTEPPTGTLKINNGLPGEITYSRVVHLQFEADDFGGSGLQSYRLSDNGETFSEASPYKSTRLYQLSETPGLKTVHVKYIDGAGNISSAGISASIFYSNELDLTDLTAASGSTNFSVTPGITNDESSYHITVPFEVGSLTLTPAKRRPAVTISASGANVTFNGSQVVMSNLQPGSNYADIAVGNSDGSAQKVYKVLVYKQVSSLSAAKGSKVWLGGKLWTVVDPEKRTLFMDDPANTCPWNNTVMFCQWEKGQSYWSTNDVAYRFRTDYPNTIPYYLNHEFYDSLGQQKEWIDEFPFDNTMYEKSTVFLMLPSGMTRSAETRTAAAKVGLLSVEDFTTLKNEGILSSSLWSGNNWYLMNPQNELSTDSIYSISMLGVDGETGSVISENDAVGPSFLIRPVIHLKDRAFIIEGEGTQDRPYMIGSGEGLTNIEVSGGSLMALPPAGDIHSFVINAASDSTITIKATIPNNVTANVYWAPFTVSGNILTVNVPANVTDLDINLSGTKAKLHKFSIARSTEYGDGHIQRINFGESKLLFQPDDLPPTWELNVNSVTASVYMSVNLNQPLNSRIILDSSVTGVTYGRDWIRYDNLNPGINTINFTLRYDDNTEKHYRILITQENPAMEKTAAPVPQVKYMSDTVLQISFTSPTEGAAIYYTLDGSSPSVSSLNYMPGSPINIRPGQTLTAIAVKSGWLNSDVIAIIGKERYSVKEIVNRINSRTDTNNDGVFDRKDVIHWLKQIPPRFVQEISAY